METKRAALREVTTSIRTGGPSILEMESVGPLTVSDYRRRLKLFDDFCAQAGLPTHSDIELERALLEYFDVAYLSGLPFDTGTKLLAAVGWRAAHLRRPARTGALARARQALQGWGRLDPLATRLPLPWPALAGIAFHLCHAGHWRVAVGVMLAAEAYLRPGELLSLSGHSVVPPNPRLGMPFRFPALVLFPREEGMPSKVGLFDDSVILDALDDHAWIPRAALMLKATVASHEQLVGVDAPRFRQLLAEAAAKAGLAHWSVTPYALRHTGPSHDFLAQRRSLASIKRRGRWSSDQSVRRYEKASQVTARLARLPPATLSFLRAADRELPAILERRRLASAELLRLAAAVPTPCP